jgi:hypothetical protein
MVLLQSPHTHARSAGKCQRRSPKLKRMLTDQSGGLRGGGPTEDGGNPWHPCSRRAIHGAMESIGRVAFLLHGGSQITCRCSCRLKCTSES